LVAVADGIALAGAAAAEGVVAADSVGGDPHHGPALVGKQLGAGAEVEVALFADGVGGAVAFGVGGEVAAAEAVFDGFDEEGVCAVLAALVAGVLVGEGAQRAASLPAVELPPTVLCQPTVSSMTEQKMRPMSE